MPAPSLTGSAWPILLDDNAMAKLLTCTKPALRRMVATDAIPIPRNVAGLDRWHLHEVAAHLSHLFELDDADTLLMSRKAAAAAVLKGWSAPTKRPIKKGSSP